MKSLAAWAAKQSDGRLARAYEEAQGYARAGAEGYAETLRALEAELRKREIL